MQKQALRREVDANYDFLQRNLGEWLSAHEGQYALLRHCKLEGFFERPGDAYREALARYPDRLFSIQEVTAEPLELGFLSVAAV